MPDRPDLTPDRTPAPDTRHLPTPFSLPGNPATNKAAARKLYGVGLGGMAFGVALQQRMGKHCDGVDLADAGCNFIEDMVERMNPRDPMEEMLVIQAALAHARVLHLSESANRQERLTTIRTVNEYADRASNTFRRLMLALAEYRRPPRSGDNFTAIRQANIAGQQVVMHGETRPIEKATNEQGQEPGSGPQSLPADAGGAGVLAGLSSPREAMGAIHGAEVARG